jgi:hypothetical protein
MNRQFASAMNAYKAGFREGAEAGVPNTRGFRVLGWEGACTRTARPLIN